MTSIQEITTEIRDAINRPRRRNSLLRVKAVWGMLCSSLDVIGDTELAMEAYLKSGDRKADAGQEHDHLTVSGNLYIGLYGILQIVFVQQDAVKHLAESLGFDYAHDPKLKAIREIRNDAVGHPTKRGRAEAFNFISRMTLSRSGCHLITFLADGSTQYRDISIPDMIAAQRLAVTTALSSILQRLREDEMAHRKKFIGNDLADAFPSTLGYYHEKIAESIDGGMPDSFGAGILESVIGYVTKFKEALAERGLLDAYDSITYEIDLLGYPFAELQTYFTNPQESKLNEKDAMIFHHFIRNRVDNLIGMAKEIDQEYKQES